jgi:hypothetical protein
MPPVSFSCKFCCLAYLACAAASFPAAMCSSHVCMRYKNFRRRPNRRIAWQDLQLMKFINMVYSVTVSYHHTVCCVNLKYQQLGTIFKMDSPVFHIYDCHLFMEYCNSSCLWCKLKILCSEESAGTAITYILLMPFPAPHYPVF